MTVVKQASLHSDLATQFGVESVERGSPDFAVDGETPQAAVRPRTYEEVGQLLSTANERGLAVIPLGGRNHAGLGNAPERYDIALDLSRLDQVVEFEPADLTITVQAGLTLGELRRVAGESGLMVPFDPSLQDAATVGGTLAANVSGPARVGLGTARDFTIGMRVATPNGRMTRAGGRVVKNVAGYDLCKLYIGSLGTLGVIVEATFKTLPLPKAERTLRFEFPGPGAACETARSAYVRGLAMRSALMTHDKGTWRLEIGLAGMPAAVERSAGELGGSATERGTGTRGAPLVAKISVLPSDLPALLSETADSVLDAIPTAGVCRIGSREPARDSVERLQALARRFSGTCVIEACPPALKRDIDVFGEAPPSLGLMRAVKREFDPARVLSPGRLVGRI